MPKTKCVWLNLNVAARAHNSCRRLLPNTPLSRIVEDALDEMIITYRDSVRASEGEERHTYHSIQDWLEEQGQQPRRSRPMSVSVYINELLWEIATTTFPDMSPSEIVTEALYTLMVHERDFRKHRDIYFPTNGNTDE